MTSSDRLGPGIFRPSILPESSGGVWILRDIYIYYYIYILLYIYISLVLQDPSESVFWAGFKGRFIPPEKVFGALGYIYIPVPWYYGEEWISWECQVVAIFEITYNVMLWRRISFN